MTEYLFSFLYYDHYYYYCQQGQIQLDLEVALRE